ncbi:DUF938 domain-containing protein [Salinicola rhizosphaerae]|uniref:SAM-dependent methyltransferase n=1 Tax=Salinicola rhizosphaerae TaxID=1443141 RepID=A0ABQ3E8J7_9GAMM|nr:DUF938 domain-containing protein [Salinicola rhizosphaerae]GHB28401.1 SAM-dependent methyltransferase [Salinicola rhizosphaerae]
MNSMDVLEDGADRRLSSPAALRNRQPILDVLRGTLPNRGTVLEIASGSGEHAIAFAEALAPLRWQPSDISESALASIEAWRQQAGLENLLTPLRLDVSGNWPQIPALAAVVCINMIHISPWAAAEALFAAAGRALPPDGVLVIYGPFKRDGQHTAPSNERFDRDLRTRDSRWGVRDLEAVEALAARHGLVRQSVHDMPANNLGVVWRRDG